MLRTLFCTLLIRSPPPVRKANMPSAPSLPIRHSTTNVLILAEEWSRQLLGMEDSSTDSNAVIRAASKSLPLLEDATSVPFVCRYRADVIHPLTTQQVHLLCDLTLKHKALTTSRKRLLDAIPQDSSDGLIRRIQTSTSKIELDDLYAPYKPPSKGSISDRIGKDYPALVTRVDKLWNGEISVSAASLKPRDAAVHLLGTKISAEPGIIDAVTETMSRYCRVTVKKGTDPENKYRTYHDFGSNLSFLRDHQVLAIRRGSDQKALKMGYDVDGDKMEGSIRWNLLANVLPKPLAQQLKRDFAWRELVQESIHDAWSRLLRRRGTSRLWTGKCKVAEERAMKVFEQNLFNALLAPPQAKPSYVLAMDPGFQAGIKCAIIDPNGRVTRKGLSTVQFLGNKRDNAVKTFGELLSTTRGLATKKQNQKVIVALGNGHGTQESRALIQDASSSIDIPIEIHLVNEAGASVWSVTEHAKKEFPKEPPSAIAAISIGRRLQNPMHELVKVPPKSLGLGMYQHDLSEKELDEKLHLASVDAVATVGVDANSCSLEILQKVPGLNKLAHKIIKARPLLLRNDLLGVSGLGPKTYENCAAFVRVRGAEGLDSTLVHPESYKLARWLLKKLNWTLTEAPKDLPPPDRWEAQWEKIIIRASKKFNVSQERVLAVIQNLVDSMTHKDPREASTSAPPAAGSINGCSMLSPDLISKLPQACHPDPIRRILGTIRNIADFGAFVDFGAHDDGLLHISKLGPVRLDSFLIGQEVGVDILSVNEQNKVSLGLTGLQLEPDKRSSFGTSGSGKGSAAGKKRSISTPGKSGTQAKRRKITKT